MSQRQQLVTNEMRDYWEKANEEMDAQEVTGRGGLTKADILVRILENTKQWCSENPKQLVLETAASTNTMGSGAVATYATVLIKMVKRMAPNLVALDFWGTQPTDRPDTLIFAMRKRYSTPTGTEAQFNEPNSAFSGTGSQGADPFQGATSGSNPTYGTTMTTTTGESLGSTTPWAKMAISIEKASVSVGTRGLYADYSHEIRQDMMAVHGEDVDSILSDVLITEIQAEMNREFIRTMNVAAKWGAYGATTVGEFDLQADTDGRYFVERLKYMMFQFELDANQIALDTRMGKGNRMLCSPNVASALAMVGLLDYNISNLDSHKNIKVDPTGQTFAGVLANGMRVYIDPYAVVDYYNIWYKGPTELDAGIYYVPYRPLEMYRTQGEDNFNPRMGFKTRYGVVSNPFYYQDAAGNVASGKGLGAQENGYGRKAKVTNLF